MALLLHMSTSTKNCSVCISKKGKLLSLIEEKNENYSHSEKLHVFITYALEGAKITLKDLDAISIDKGPGSYTGLRIGVSAAKGLCFGLKIPLIALDSLTILAAAAQSVIQSKGYFIPMLDARRKEVYTCVFDNSKNQISLIEALILNENSFEKYPSNQTYILGDGSIKAKEIFKKKFHYLDHLYPSSKEMIGLSYLAFKEKKFEALDFFEPFYLKNFVSLN
jgi:tRNA threonylcarbamoyladenosine biosynthesis protein TsaB